jgi:hypothetical protein
MDKVQKYTSSDTLVLIYCADLINCDFNSVLLFLFNYDCLILVHFHRKSQFLYL